MDHESTQMMISRYIDSDLPDVETPEMFFHLQQCAECRHFFSAMWRVHRSPLYSPLPDVMKTLDRKLSSLSVGIRSDERTITFSPMRVMYTAGAVVLMMLYIYGMSLMQEEHQMSQYLQGVSALTSVSRQSIR